MTTHEVANQYVAYVREGKFSQILDELYAEDAVSLEPEGAMVPVSTGLDAIRAKGKQWNEMVEEVHGGGCSDPLVADNHFTLTMWTETTMKEFGRSRMDEVCVYEVKDGKIVKEQFIYSMNPPQ